MAKKTLTTEEILGKVIEALKAENQEQALKLMDDNHEQLEETVYTEVIINPIELLDFDEAINLIEDVLNDDTKTMEVSGSFDEKQEALLNVNEITDLVKSTDIIQTITNYVNRENAKHQVLSTVWDDIVEVLKDYQESGGKVHKLDGYKSYTVQYDKQVKQELLAREAIFTMHTKTFEGCEGTYHISLNLKHNSFYIKVDQYIANKTGDGSRNNGAEYYVATVKDQKITEVKEEFTQVDLDLNDELEAAVQYAKFQQLANTFKNKMNNQVFQDNRFWLENSELRG